MPVSEVICRLDFLRFVGVHIFAFSAFPGELSVGKTSRPIKKSNGSDILLKVLYSVVRISYISEENQVGFGSSGGITHYSLYPLILNK